MTPKAENDMHARFDFYEKKKQRDIEDKRKEAETKRYFFFDNLGTLQFKANLKSIKSLKL